MTLVTVGLDKVFAQRISNRLSLYEKLACPSPQLGPFFPKFDLCIVNPSENSEIGLMFTNLSNYGASSFGGVGRRIPGGISDYNGP